MDNGELPDFENKSALHDEEVESFVRDNIWPAAIYFWGTGFRNPNALMEADDVYAPFETPDGEGMVVINFYIQDDQEEYHQDDEPGEDDYEPELSVNASLDVLRNDLRELLPRKYKTLEVWKISTYRFPVVGDDEPSVVQAFILKNNKGEEIHELADDQANFLEQIEDLESATFYRDSSLTGQDCIDIHNMLLALEIPEAIISLPD